MSAFLFPKIFFREKKTRLGIFRRREYVGSHSPHKTLQDKGRRGRPGAGRRLPALSRKGHGLSFGTERKRKIHAFERLRRTRLPHVGGNRRQGQEQQGLYPKRFRQLPQHFRGIRVPGIQYSGRIFRRGQYRARARTARQAQRQKDDRKTPFADVDPVGLRKAQAPTPCRADRNSASRSRGRSSKIPKSSWRTSRRARSIPLRGNRCSIL